MTRLVNVYRDECDVRITRPGIYGNPVAFGKPCPVCGETHTRAEGVQGLLCYGATLLDRLRTDRDFVLGLHAIEGRTLGCVCAPAHCHGDLLVAYLGAFGERLAIQEHCGGADIREPERVAHRSGLIAVRGHLAWLREQLPRQQWFLA